MFEKLQSEPVLSRPDLVPECVTNFLNSFSNNFSDDDVLVAPIDPDFAGSKEFCEKYSIPEELGANCVIVEAVRGDKRFLAACLVPIGTRADLNKTVKKLLDVRRVSFAPLEEVLKETGMEYGGITPVGLPQEWPILIDQRIINLDKLIVGGGFRKSKLLVKGEFLAKLPNVQVVEALGM